MTSLEGLKQLSLKAVRIELSKRSFWDFEKYINRSFFTNERHHLKEIADLLQFGGDRIMINLPPRHGKSYTMINFCMWLLGRNNAEKIITISYNDTLSGRFSKAVRDGIETQSIGEVPCFQDVFPGTAIRRGDAAAQLWSLEGQHFSYLGGSPGGTLTGMGATIGIIDDLIKNEYEANNEEALDKHYRFYTDTFLSRLETGARQIIIATRWSKKDLCGRLLEEEPGRWQVLKMEAFDGKQMLCPDLLTKEDYDQKRRMMSDEIFGANYHQEPLDVKGKLYKQLKTYTELPDGVRRNYTDTADQGDDYLCSIDYVEWNNEVYILDVYFTKEGMETTEPAMAERLNRNEINECYIESNNGGRGFARNVQRICNEIGNRRTVIKWFTQTRNKISRILSSSAWVQEHVYFPANWKDRWPEFYNHVTGYLKSGKNKHDDAPDVLAGIYEKMNTRKVYY